MMLFGDKFKSYITKTVKNWQKSENYLRQLFQAETFGQVLYHQKATGFNISFPQKQGLSTDSSTTRAELTGRKGISPAFFEN